MTDELTADDIEEGDRFVYGRDEYEVINIREDTGGTHWIKTKNLRGTIDEFHIYDLQKMERRDPL